MRMKVFSYCLTALTLSFLIAGVCFDVPKAMNVALFCIWSLSAFSSIISIVSIVAGNSVKVKNYEAWKEDILELEGIPMSTLDYSISSISTITKIFLCCWVGGFFMFLTASVVFLSAIISYCAYAVIKKDKEELLKIAGSARENKVLNIQ